MKKTLLRSIGILAIFFAVLAACFALAGCSALSVPHEKGYYFDGSAKKNGDGSYGSPFNTLSAIHNLSFDDGEKVFLKRGTTFYGSLHLEGISGRENSPVFITAYGTGDKPKIDGNGQEGEAVVEILNCNYLVVENLEIFNSDSTEGDRKGVRIGADAPEGTEGVLTYHDITVRNLYIHDIKGYLDVLNNGMDWSSKMTGGIHIKTYSSHCRFDGITVSHNEIYNVDNVGIASSGVSSEPYDEDFREHAFLNVEISYNHIHNIGKNAIFMRGLFGGYIEHNVVHDTSVRCYSGNQIVTALVYGTVIQYNEGYNNMARVNDLEGANKTGLMDGCMLDADLRSRYTVWQYNYSHDNSFGLFLNCTGTSGSDTNSKDIAVVRYNLSVCDKGNKGVLYVNYYAKGVEFYNNTIITGLDTNYILQANENRTYHIFNNLIYNRSQREGGARLYFKNTATGSIHNNLFFSVNDLPVENVNKILSDPDSVNLDPMFQSLDIDTFESRCGYDKALRICRVMASSPALDSTKAISVEDVKTDFAGNPYKPSFGCVCA